MVLLELFDNLIERSDSDWKGALLIVMALVDHYPGEFFTVILAACGFVLDFVFGREEVLLAFRLT